MTLALMVAGRQTGTFGTFEVVDGNVSKNRVAILNFFNETTALVPMNARSSFTTPEEHAAFDATLMGLSTTGVGIQYIESIPKFMDPKARFKEWLDGTLTPASVGLKLTAEELAVPSAFASAKAKFEELFTPPKPVLSAGGIDLLEAGYTNEQAVAIDNWRSTPGNSLPSSISRKANEDQKHRNVLRLICTGGDAYRIENVNGHSMTRTQFLRGYNQYIKPQWDRVPPNGEIGRLGSSFYLEGKQVSGRYASDHEVTVYNNYVVIGCQSIPRAEVERIVGKLEEISPSK